MSDIDKIVALLKSEAVERRIAAAIVLGEIKAKGTPVHRRARATRSRAGSGRCSGTRSRPSRASGSGGRCRRMFPLLVARDEDVRRAAVAAVVSAGEEVLPTLRARIAGASSEEKRAIDAVLAALGGRDAFEALLEGLGTSDAGAAKAAAIAVRQRVKDADARQRRSYFAQVQKFLEKVARRGGAPGAVAAGAKILGYLEDERATPLLVELTARGRNDPSVRQEALIALRFLFDKKSEGGGLDAVVAALVDAAQDPDRSLAQTALHTLAGIRLPPEAMRPNREARHPCGLRARPLRDGDARTAGRAARRARAGQRPGDDDRQAAGRARGGVPPGPRRGQAARRGGARRRGRAARQGHPGGARRRPGLAAAGRAARQRGEGPRGDAQAASRGGAQAPGER